jgi:putative drug exporter of the RND superfamily
MQRAAQEDLVASFARWCFTHRWTVLAVWLVALVGCFGLGRAVGSTYSNSFSLPGTDSSQAENVLEANFPAEAGDSDQIVVQAKSGTLRSPATEAAVTSMLDEVARLPQVRSVTSPYDPAGQISSNGTIGLATVNLDAAAQNVPKAAVTKLISTAEAARSASLDVQLGGQAIEDNQPKAGSGSLLLGIVLALVVLFFAFRRAVLGALLPLITALAGIGVATSLIDVFTHAFTIATWTPEVATLMALGVGVDYALFIVSRHRRWLLDGQSPEAAAVSALDTSGRAVLLAGLTVCVALLGMFALQVSFLYGVAVSVALAVALTMVASLTLLPAMLGFFGLKVLRRSERAGLEDRQSQPEQAEGFWLRWAQWLRGNALVSSVAALAVIVVLALPFFSMRLGLPDASTDPSSSTTYQAYKLLAKGFGPGFSGPLQVVGQVSSPADRSRFAAFIGDLQHEPGVARAESARESPNGRAEVAVVYPTTGPQQVQTADLLQRVRAAVPSAEAGTTLAIHIGGDTAVNQDFSQVLTNKMPQFLAVVVGLAFLLLLLVFRSLLIPLVASIMNLLSFGVALGVMTATFQYGWGKSVLGFNAAGPIMTWLPVMMFAILFGLSMDYDVFLVSRMHEEWMVSHDTERAVTRGQAETGRVITVAALIMILVFGAFLLGGEMDLEQIGLGFAAAIFVDAFVIRTVLVPSVMHKLGRANWWAPQWLDRMLPHLTVEPADLITDRQVHTDPRRLSQRLVNVSNVSDGRDPRRSTVTNRASSNRVDVEKETW